MNPEPNPNPNPKDLEARGSSIVGGQPPQPSPRFFKLKGPCARNAGAAPASTTGGNVMLRLSEEQRDIVETATRSLKRDNRGGPHPTFVISAYAGTVART
mmetsp:Transcript_19665/g.59558  ORF Transcript_19665/g.59558 Transcript_19665/m.59558 type:complete len:100 (-) Transcript_19665:128-427(-)